jgi:2-(3-amino-3-carboxypropyl)histidine synthase
MALVAVSGGAPLPAAPTPSASAPLASGLPPPSPALTAAMAALPPN